MTLPVRRSGLSLKDVSVNVRRQDSISVENVPLLEELDKFFLSHFPGWEERMISVPEGFEYDQERLHHVEGVLDVMRSEARERNERKLNVWVREAHGQQGKWRSEVIGE